PPCCSLLCPWIRGNIGIPDIVNFFNCEIGMLAVTYLAAFHWAVRRLVGIDHHVRECIGRIVMTGGAYLPGRLDPTAIDALPAYALLADSARLGGRARCAGVRVALGAVPDVLGQEDLREIDEGVLESDVGEHAWRHKRSRRVVRRKVVSLCVAF